MIPVHGNVCFLKGPRLNYIRFCYRHKNWGQWCLEVSIPTMPDKYSSDGQPSCPSFGASEMLEKSDSQRPIVACQNPQKTFLLCLTYDFAAFI